MARLGDGDCLESLQPRDAKQKKQVRFFNKKNFFLPKKKTSKNFFFFFFLEVKQFMLNRFTAIIRHS